MSIEWKRVGGSVAFNRGARVPIGLEGVLLATLSAIVGEEKTEQSSRQDNEDAANSQSRDECDPATTQLGTPTVRLVGPGGQRSRYYGSKDRRGCGTELLY